MDQSTIQCCKDYEHQILRLAGMRRSEYSLGECQLGPGRHIHYLRVHKTPASDTNVLLVTHGYFASCMAFFKMYPLLQNDFHIISFDTVGHGLSSYDEATPESIDGWIEYFVSDIKAFADKLGLKRFHAMGHSLGAYIMGQFADRHPERVRQLFLLSPAGVNQTNLEYSRRVKERTKRANCFVRKMVKSVADKVFVQKQSPMDHWAAKALRKTLIGRFYSKRLSLSKAEQRLFRKMYVKISKRRPSSEKCLGYLFNQGPMSDRPLFPILKRLHEKLSICIMYGATDWMDRRLATQRIRGKNLNVAIETVAEAGHQLVFQNPLEVCQKVLCYFRAEQGAPGAQAPGPSDL